MPVVEDGELVGIVSEADLVARNRRDLLAVLARSDEEIATALEVLLTDELGPTSPFRVTVRDGVAQLSGPGDPTTRELAARLARGVPGVVGVRLGEE